MMRKKRVYFSEINNVIADAIFLPLSVGYIWEYCNSLPDISAKWELGGILFERDTVENILSKIDSPDVFAISTYVWNWEISQQLAIAIKNKWPDCLIVMGGPQVPYTSSWLLLNRDKTDLIVTYGGERPFAEILRGSKNIPGVIAVDYPYTKPEPDREIDYIPSPYISGLMNSLMSSDKKYSAIIETNRGCPYACTFCDQEDIYYNKLSKFNEERVLKEIDWMSENKIEFLFFADSNLGILERDLVFIKQVANNRNRTGYPNQIDYATAKQQPERIIELGRILNHEAGIKRGVTIALQSMHKPTLDAIKRINIANEKLSDIVKTYNDHKIENYCELIIGLPEETFDSWISGLGEILELGSSSALTVHPLSVVHNTPFGTSHYKEKYGLKYTRTVAPAGGNTYPHENKGEYDWICYESNTMTKDEWIDAYFFAKGIIIPHHYHGVSQVIAQYLNEFHSIRLIDFYLEVFKFSKYKTGSYLHNEYVNHTTSVIDSLFHDKIWGRPVTDSNFYFQDNAATAAELYENIDIVHKELVEMVLEKYNVNCTEVAEYNKLILDRYGVLEDTTSKEFTKNWDSWFTDNKPLTINDTTVKVRNNKYSSKDAHAKKLFWYGRKSKRCFLTDREEL
jgi:radical SAM superfamily enzyme YgiQ (UPF0313 family)